MKKLLLVLFAVGLIAAFSMPAVAADVKFFGDYYAAGYWTSNYSLSDSPTAVDSGARSTIGQRLRINTIFQVAEGLKLTTRFDAMERMWGQDAAMGTPNPTSGVGTNGENNISWERAYVTFNLGPGFFDVGYQAEGYWSPIAFGNTTGSGPVIRYTMPIGPVTVGAFWENLKESNIDPTVYQPADWDRVGLQGTYKWKSGQAGIQALWEHYESKGGETLNFAWTNYTLPAGAAGTFNAYEISPFFQAKLGPVDLEGKLYWTIGEIDPKGAGQDIDVDGLSAYLNAKVNIGPAYVGAMAAYVKGDDPKDSDATLSHSGGQDWDPTLMLGNDRYHKWQGGRYSTLTGFGTGNSIPFRGGWNETNVWIYQGYVGVKPTPKLALKASFTYMAQDERQTAEYQDKHLGNEFDITAAYKIYPNLEYMIGFGYLWTGDYFKGKTPSSALVDDNYLLMHQLTLTF